LDADEIQVMAHPKVVEWSKRLEQEADAGKSELNKPAEEFSKL